MSHLNWNEKNNYKWEFSKKIVKMMFLHLFNEIYIIVNYIKNNISHINCQFKRVIFTLELLEMGHIYPSSYFF